MPKKLFTSIGFLVGDSENVCLTDKVFIECETIEDCRKVLKKITKEINKRLLLDINTPIQFITRTK